MTKYFAKLSTLLVILGLSVTLTACTKSGGGGDDSSDDGDDGGTPSVTDSAGLLKSQCGFFVDGSKESDLPIVDSQQVFVEVVAADLVIAKSFTAAGEQ